MLEKRLNVPTKYIFMSRLNLTISDHFSLHSIYRLSFLTEANRVLCEVRTGSLHIICINFSLQSDAVAFSPAFHCGHFLLPAPRFPSVSVIPILHTHLYPHVALTTKPNRRNLETLQKATIFRQSGSIA